MMLVALLTFCCGAVPCPGQGLPNSGTIPTGKTVAGNTLAGENSPARAAIPATVAIGMSNKGTNLSPLRNAGEAIFYSAATFVVCAL